jgi:hypothetical protein
LLGLFHSDTLIKYSSLRNSFSYLNGAAYPLVGPILFAYLTLNESNSIYWFAESSYVRVNNKRVWGRQCGPRVKNAL